MRTGVCWYPEHWPESRWADDVRLMADTGLSLVRVGEFAWSAYEPARDRFDWGWLDRAIGVLADAGLGVVLGTPTATPPVWLTAERPEVLSVGPDGARRATGSRRHTCPTSPAYREEAARIVGHLVDRYGGHDAVVAWQIDNEPGNHDSARCWCDACRAAFTTWLTDRYGDAATLNAAWGTTFWSMTYPDLASVDLPRPTMTAQSPSLELAHRRFASEQAVAGLVEQQAIIRAGSPGRDITTNFYVGDTFVDGRAMAATTGLGAVDSYPHDTAGPHEVAYTFDLARGLAGTGRGWVMEQQAGPINWTPSNPLVPDGQVRIWGLQAALAGVEALLWFRWRAARYGQEQYHSGLLRHDGTPDRGLAEAAALAGDLADAADAGWLERPAARVALLHSYEDAWAVEIEPHRAGLRHRDLVLPAHAAARRLGEAVDVVDPLADLTGYAVVLAPALHLWSAQRQAALEAALDAGAVVVLGPRTFARDLDSLWVDVPEPAGLAERLGARVDVSRSNAAWPPAGAPTGLAVGGHDIGPWVETYRVDADDAEVLATYAGRPLEGAPAVVRRGSLVAVGCAAEPVWVDVLAGLLGAAPAPEGVEVHVRAGHRIELDHRDLALRVTAT
jgi:beta-galactosidase